MLTTFRFIWSKGVVDISLGKQKRRLLSHGFRSHTCVCMYIYICVCTHKIMVSYVLLINNCKIYRQTSRVDLRVVQNVTNQIVSFCYFLELNVFCFFYVHLFEFESEHLRFKLRTTRGGIFVLSELIWLTEFDT